MRTTRAATATNATINGSIDAVNDTMPAWFHRCLCRV